MKIKILAPYKGATTSGLYGMPTADIPSGEIPIGAEIEVTKEPLEWAGRYEVISGSTEGKTAVINPADGENQQVAGPVAPFLAKDKGGGWWGIFDAKDTEVAKSIRKDDAEAFNTMSDEDKAEYVKTLSA
jgi:hypothetical protein